MKTLPIVLCMYMVSLVSSLPIISKPLENNPDHLVWEALLTVDAHRSDDKTRKIPKSIFITPNLNESKGNCPPDHKLGPDGRCYKTLKIDPLVILKTQIESLLKKNNTATTEYDEDYDYSEYGESTESMNANGQYTVPLSFGFGNENRVSPQQQPQQHQQTTFPNLNRVVKDDSHIVPLDLHVSSEKQNQPFLVSTTGLGLGTEDDIDETQPEISAEIATASSLVSSTPKDSNALETTSISSSTTSSPSSTSSSSVSTVSTTNTESSSGQDFDAQQTTISTITSNEHPTDETSTTTAASVMNTEYHETSTMLSSLLLPSSSSGKSFTSDDDIIYSTDQAETQTPNTISSEDSIKDADISENSTINSTEDTELLANTPTEIAMDEKNDKIVTLTQSTNEIGTVPSSTSIPMEQVSPQNESTKQMPAISHIVKEFVSKHSTTTSHSYDDAELNVNHTDNASTMSAKFADDSYTESADTLNNNKIVIVQAKNLTETTNATESTSDKNFNSYDFIDAIFVPSQSESIDELDPANGKVSNNSNGELKYRLTNTTTVEELPEAEIAPIIDTGKGSQSSIELIDVLDELSQMQRDSDEQKNLTARLADELLLEDPDLEYGTDGTVQELSSPLPPPPSTTTTATPPRLTLSSIDDLNLHRSHKNTEIEEALNGASHESALNIAAGEVATEESIDYDSKKINSHTKKTNLPDNDEIIRNIDSIGELPEKEAALFHIPQIISQPSTTIQPPLHAKQQPSIYTTFINRLKYTPPVVNLDDQQPDSIQYSHSPFDIATLIRNVNVNRWPISQSSSHPPFSLTDADRSIEVSPAVADLSSGRGKSLQLGINCYLKNLVNKQQFIICDNA